MRECGTFGQRLCASAKPQFRRHKTNTVLSDTLRLYDDPVIAWLLTFAPKIPTLAVLDALSMAPPEGAAHWI
jgi:hypothetical protein